MNLTSEVKLPVLVVTKSRLSAVQSQCMVWWVGHTVNIKMTCENMMILNDSQKFVPVNVKGIVIITRKLYPLTSCFLSTPARVSRRFDLELTQSHVNLWNCIHSCGNDHSNKCSARSYQISHHLHNHFYSHHSRRTFPFCFFFFLIHAQPKCSMSSLWLHHCDNGTVNS